MAILSGKAFMPSRRGEAGKREAAAHDEIRRGQVISTIILVIFLFQFVNLPGAILDKSAVDIGTIMLGILLCMVAMMLNRLGWVKVVSVLIIAVVDLGCGLMVLTSPMGLDVSTLPVFDLLILSELIAVSLLPAVSIFWISACNVLFIIVAIVFMPHTTEMQMLLSSSMAYNAITQPLCLQIIVAVVMYVWVRNTLKAYVRADGAEQLIESHGKKIEKEQQQLDLEIEHLVETLTMACNDNHTVRTNLNKDNILWQLGSGLNILLARLQRLRLIEQENQHLQAQVNRQKELIYQMKFETQPKDRPSSRSSRGL